MVVFFPHRSFLQDICPALDGAISSGIKSTDYCWWFHIPFPTVNGHRKSGVLIFFTKLQILIFFMIFLKYNMRSCTVSYFWNAVPFLYFHFTCHSVFILGHIGTNLIRLVHTWSIPMLLLDVIFFMFLECHPMALPWFHPSKRMTFREAISPLFSI